MRIIGALFLIVLLAGCQVQFKGNDLAGVVTSEKGPEAGVWVIAETSDLRGKESRPRVVKFQLRPDPLAK